MVIITKHQNKHTLKTWLMVHYFNCNKLIKSTEKLDEITFDQFKKQLLKNHKSIMLVNVASVTDLKLNKF